MRPLLLQAHPSPYTHPPPLPYPAALLLLAAVEQAVQFVLVVQHLQTLGKKVGVRVMKVGRVVVVQLGSLVELANARKRGWCW